MRPMARSYFRLCLEREVSGLQVVHGPEQRIALVSYGKKHEDLGPF